MRTELAPAYSISTANISESAGRTQFAKSLQGVVVQLTGITIDSVSDVDESGFITFVFHDGSGEKAAGLANVYTLTQPIQTGSFSYLRGLIHQPRPGEYEVIAQHLVP